jgi:hypothetical protein
MAKFLGYGDIKEKDNSKFLKLPEGNYRVKFLTAPIEFVKDFGRGEGPQTQYMVAVLDPQDGNKVKYLKVGATILRALKAHKENCDQDPAAPEAPLFAINRTGSDMSTKYSLSVTNKTVSTAHIDYQAVQEELMELAAKIESK